MIKYFFASVFFIALTFQYSNAQYYYKDIVSVKQANAEKMSLQEQKIRNIIVHSFEADGTPSEGFHCEKKISKDYQKVEMFTRSAETTKSLTTSYYNHKNQLIQSSDSSELNATTTLYEYDAADNIVKITSYSHSSDDDFSTALKEVHEYSYDKKNTPVKMLRIKNDRDTAYVDFLSDEKGNITDEIETGTSSKHYYYYYDAKKRLTDIVKYNVVRKKPVPDFIFEYNSENQVTQMMVIEEGVPGYYYNEKDAPNYYTWRYIYNEGLKIIEKCFASNRKLLGYVEYEYK